MTIDGYAMLFKAVHSMQIVHSIWHPVVLAVGSGWKELERIPINSNRGGKNSNHELLQAEYTDEVHTADMPDYYRILPDCNTPYRLQHSMQIVYSMQRKWTKKSIVRSCGKRLLMTSCGISGRQWVERIGKNSNQFQSWWKEFQSRIAAGGVHGWGPHCRYARLLPHITCLCKWKNR